MPPWQFERTALKNRQLVRLLDNGLTGIELAMAGSRRARYWTIDQTNGAKVTISQILIEIILLVDLQRFIAMPRGNNPIRIIILHVLGSDFCISLSCKYPAEGRVGLHSAVFRGSRSLLHLRRHRQIPIRNLWSFVIVHSISYGKEIGQQFLSAMLPGFQRMSS